MRYVGRVDATDGVSEASSMVCVLMSVSHDEHAGLQNPRQY
jgi:hypothetical protein